MTEQPPCADAHDLPPITFQGFPVITQPTATPCHSCGKSPPCLLKCTNCRHEFCMLGCVDVDTRVSPVTCPKCDRENAILEEELDYREAELRMRARLQETQKHDQLRKLQAWVGVEDIMPTRDAWRWAVVDGKNVARKLVPPTQAMRHTPPRGAVITVLDQHGNQSPQVTLRGTATQKGAHIDLIVEVEIYDPEGKRQDISMAHFEEFPE